MWNSAVNGPATALGLSDFELPIPDFQDRDAAMGQLYQVFTTDGPAFRYKYALNIIHHDFCSIHHTCDGQQVIIETPMVIIIGYVVYARIFIQHSGNDESCAVGHLERIGIAFDGFASCTILCHTGYLPSRHLLAVTSSLGRSSFEERFHGFSHRLKLFNDRETNKAEARLVTLEASETSLYSEVQDSFSKLFQDRYPFDGILFSNDSLAFPSINVILSHGYKIPADIKIVSRGNILIARHGQVRLTSICPDVQGISKCAADVLVRMMSGEEIENRTILFTSKLIPRESTRGKDEV